ncbi:MAG: 2-hydroxychromene-2-carboxylate isomerase [Oleiphilaceae bacterium]|nr:2-hydroxychromene-2-carboxylate isomerase [Oleiphilaceae bacterium]
MSDSAKQIEFYFDFGSPTAYLAHKQLAKMSDKYNADVVYEPMLLGAVHKATNNTPPGLVPAKGKYMLLSDIPRFVRRYGVEFKMNPHFPVNTLQLMRGVFAAMELDCVDAYIDVVYDAMWVKGLDMSKPEVIDEVLTEAGIDAAAFAELVQQDEIKNQLKEATEAAVKRGCFGAPTMFLDNEMYFGQDRLDFIEDVLSA